MAKIKQRKKIRDLHFEFKFQDMWVGVYWDSRYNIGYEAYNGVSEKVKFDLWICFIPCFPLHYCWYR